jgi:hypothetical protein
MKYKMDEALFEQMALEALEEMMDEDGLDEGLRDWWAQAKGAMGGLRKGAGAEVGAAGSAMKRGLQRAGKAVADPVKRAGQAAAAPVKRVGASMRQGRSEALRNSAIEAVAQESATMHRKLVDYQTKLKKLGVQDPEFDKWVQVADRVAKKAGRYWAKERGSSATSSQQPSAQSASPEPSAGSPSKPAGDPTAPQIDRAFYGRG